MAAKQINVVFNADTGQFVANVANASKAVAAASRAVAEAKNTIVASMKEEVEAARQAGASTQQLAEIRRSAAQQIAAVEKQSQDKLDKQYADWQNRRFATQREAAARELNFARTQAGEISLATSTAQNSLRTRMEQQTQMAQSAALRNKMQSASTADPLTLRKSDLSQQYLSEIRAAKEAGASEQELAAITSRYASLRAEAVEEESERIIAARQRERQTGDSLGGKDVRSAVENAAAKAEQEAIRSQLESAPVRDPLQRRKDEIAAEYQLQREVLTAGGATEEELTELKRQFASQRVAAVEQETNRVIAERERERAATALMYKSEIDAGMRAVEQQEIQRSMQEKAANAPPPTAPGGAFAQLKAFFLDGDLGKGASEAEQVAAGFNKVGSSVGTAATATQRMTPLVRVLNGGMTNALRTATAFAQSFETLQRIASIAFIPLGLLAMVEIIEHGVEALHAWYKSAEELPSKLAEGFASIAAPMREHVDGLRKANAELDIAIAKLEHKPENLLAEALAEDVERMDQLASSTKTASDAIQHLLEQNKVGVLQNLLGTADPSGVADEIKKRFAEITAAQTADAKRFSYDTARATNDAQRQAAKDAHNTRLGDIAGKEDGLQGYIRDTRKDVNDPTGKDVTEVVPGTFMVQHTKRTWAQEHGDPQAVNAILNGSEDVADDLQNQTAVSQQNVAKENQKKSDEEKARLAREAAENARKAAEAARKADEDQRKKLEDRFKEWQRKYSEHNAAPPDAGARRMFWQGQSDDKDMRAGNKVWARDKVDTEATEQVKQNAEALKRWHTEYEKNQRTAWDLEHDALVEAGHRSAQDDVTFWAGKVKEADAGSDNYKVAADKHAAAIKQARHDLDEADRAQSHATGNQSLNATAIQAASLALQVQTGQIDRHSAALKKDALDAQAFHAQMVELYQQLAYAKKDHGDHGKEAIDAQANIDKAISERTIQIQKDTAEIVATTWQGALKNAMATWVQDAEDTASQVKQIFEQSVNGFNDTLSSFLTAKNPHDGSHWYKRLGNDFGNTARGLGKTVVDDGLKRAEAPVLKALGLSKADGSRSNPFWVKIADAMKGLFGGGDKGPSLGGSAGSAASGAVSAARGAQDAMQGAAALFKNAGTPGADDGDGGDDDSSQSDVGSTTATATQASSASKTAGTVIGTLGKLVGAFGSMFGGGKALGGGVQAGVMYDVGEMGREKFVAPANGMIIPNHALGGDAAQYTINVGHGVTPTEFEMKLQQALQTYHKRVMPAGAVAAVQNHNQRSTSNRR